MLHERLKGLKFRLPLKPLKVKLIPSEEELEACVAFGREASEIAMGKMVEMDL
jgi:flavorubredoxin